MSYETCGRCRHSVKHWTPDRYVCMGGSDDVSLVKGDQESCADFDPLTYDGLPGICEAFGNALVLGVQSVSAERTCRIKWRGDSRFGLFVIPEDYYEDDGQYVCTACGEPLPDCVDHWWDSYQADGYEGEPPFRCCPNCGAKIEVMRG